MEQKFAAREQIGRRFFPQEKDEASRPGRVCERRIGVLCKFGMLEKRHVVDGFFRMWDLGKPVIAQVHGYCLAGGTELATACDLVYVAEDAKIGYPVVRAISPPDNQFYPWIVGLRRAMELMLTGDSMSGIDAVECGFANRAFPRAELETSVLDIAERVAKVPSDIQQINKRAVHRQMDAMGIRRDSRRHRDADACDVHAFDAGAPPSCARTH
jgi:enoyl-CoA hydratase